MKENIEFWDLPIGSVFLYSFSYVASVEYYIGTKTEADRVLDKRSLNISVDTVGVSWKVTGEAYPCIMKVFEGNSYKKYCSEDFKKEFPEEII